ncbi:hypothetical protein [Streptomyces sp. NPDC049040]|uniref:hypothetical protein n=1 Tax=Streptomyces sp. NPDC049040 TaxID=3365593 RepID=UPI003717E465
MNEDDARRITAGRYRWPLPNGEAAPMSVTEFDVGFIVLPIFPPPPPRLPGQPPHMTQPGAAAVVVDKLTGEATAVPYRGDEATADYYRAIRTPPRA